MITPTYILNIVLLLGLAQGFVISILLFTVRTKPKLPHCLLAWLLFLLSLASLNIYLQESRLYFTVWQVSYILDLVPTVLAMGFGPLIYFYTRAVLQADFRITSRQKLHFLPIIIDLVPALICWYFFIGLLTHLLQRKDLQGWGDIIDTYQMYTDIPRWLSLTIYLILAKRFTDGYIQAGCQLEEQRKRSLQWIGFFLRVFLGFQGIWLVFLLFYISPAYRGILLEKVSYYPIYIPLAILIYWLGFKGYIYAKSTTTPVASRLKTNSYKVPAGTIESTVAALKKAMDEERLFLDPELSLDKLVEHLGSDQKTISHVLNQHLQQSFNNFVNGYRIQEVKRRLRGQPDEHLTLTGIAFECGFNSQATFQRTFKQFTQMTPRTYLLAQVGSSTE
jgi:AraC-like DNA-binding protein